MSREVIVRFAPSPTGPLHVGGLRTALYNYFFAKKHNGKFFLRIEDTDQTRLVEGADQYIHDTFRWLGIEFDNRYEDNFFRQSERMKHGIYKPFVNQLIFEDKAYYAFDTAEDLATARNRGNDKNVWSYNSITRDSMKNSLTLSKDEITRRLGNNEPYVIRLKVPRKTEIRFHDEVRGHIVVNSDTIDDKVLMKSDGMPTYHLANVVDDHDLNVSHVIRGEEWLPSAPFHVLLYEMFGWKDVMPKFAHLPLLLSPDGEKLSKRHGDKYGFPVFPMDWKYTNEKAEVIEINGYKEAGYLQETLINFCALMGWTPGGNLELMKVDEIIEKFSLDRINKAGIKFDIKKLNWMNNHYINQLNEKDLTFIAYRQFENRGIIPLVEHAHRIAFLNRTKANVLPDLTKDCDYFFVPPVIDETKIENLDKVKDVVTEFLIQIKEISFTGDVAKHLLIDIIKDKEYKNGEILKPIRYIVTGVPSGPELHDIFDLIGKGELVNRLAKIYSTVIY